MPKIRVVVGNTTEQVYDLPGQLDNLDAIDEAIEQFKNAALPNIEQTLLTQGQADTLTQEKKRRLIHNGVEPVTLLTRHGSFVFERPRLRDCQGREVYLRETVLSTMSTPLRTCLVFWMSQQFGPLYPLIGAIARLRDR